jgi:hypothetical protein
MFTGLAEGFVTICAIGSMSLLTGLLRAGRASAQAGEDVLAHPAGTDERSSTGKKRNDLNKPRVAF